MRRLAIFILLVGCRDASSKQAAVVPVDEADAARPQAASEIDALAAEGRELFFGRAGCQACHTVGADGTSVRGPNLGVGGTMTAPVGVRAAERRPGRHPLAYVLESILDPDAVVTPGWVAGVMRAPDEPPISLADDEALAIAVWLVGADAPITDDDLEAARAVPDEVRAARAARKAEAKTEELLRGVRWDTGSVDEGRELFTARGCGACHGKRAGVPALEGISARLGPKEIARWVIAPPKGGMPQFRNLGADELADLAAYISSL